MKQDTTSLETPSMDLIDGLEEDAFGVLDSGAGRGELCPARFTQRGFTCTEVVWPLTQIPFEIL